MQALPPEHVAEFVVQLLNVGHTIVPLIEDLADAVVSATGESPENARHQVLAMCMATVTVRLASRPGEDFRRATELVESTLAAILRDLQRAAGAAVRSSHAF
jgi:hypothetical protein